MSLITEFHFYFSPVETYKLCCCLLSNSPSLKGAAISPTGKIDQKSTRRQLVAFIKISVDRDFVTRSRGQMNPQI